MKYPSVVVLLGGEEGKALELNEVLTDFTVGSDPECHLLLKGVGISPRHASFFLDDEGQVVVSDTRSLMGVYVNRRKTYERTLRNGDEVAIGPPGTAGSGLLRFVAAPSEARPESLEDLVQLPTTPEPSPVELPSLASLVSLEEAATAPLPAFLPTTEEIPRFDVSAATPREDAQSPRDISRFPTLEIPRLDQPAPLDPNSPLASSLRASNETVPLPVSKIPPPPVSETIPLPVAAPPAPAGPPAAHPPARVAAPKPPVAEDASDPLAGLAEALGGDDAGTFVPPPPVEPSPDETPSLLKRPVDPTPLVRAARIAAAAVVLSGLAWIAFSKYTNSIVLPVIDNYQPSIAEPGQTVTINGSGFGLDSDPAGVKVMLGSVEAQVLDATPTRLNIAIPESIGERGSQTVSLKVAARGYTSTGRLLNVSVIPKITALEPRVGLTGDAIVITGRWFGNSKNKPAVTVGGNDAEVLEASPVRLRIKVPAVTAVEGQRVSVKVAVGSERGKEALLNYGRLPFVESLSPARALPGDLVTMTGIGFASGDLAVKVAGRPAAILWNSDTEVRFSLPGLRLSDNAGQKPLIVQAREKASVAYPIEVLRESAALYSPRFFVDMLESRAAVSCELGPLMVLGSDTASRKRAHDAAARLNALAAGGRAARVQFTANESTINAPDGPVLTVGVEDATGLSRGLVPLWAAHLNDLFDLFLQGRRPGRSVELSPDGRAYLDIFNAGRRRSSQGGVPLGLLISPDPAWARALTAMATTPVMGSDQALALADGEWAGVIEGSGAAQPRRIEVTLTATASGLLGQRTSRQGGLSSDVTLQNLSFVKRELRFSFSDSGEDFKYQGRLDGDAIEGSVTKASGTPVGKLTFKLAR